MKCKLKPENVRDFDYGEKKEMIELILVVKHYFY